jgi:ABC-type Fe3+/spermidine/putrescine transport system ATPase subunit
MNWFGKAGVRPESTRVSQTAPKSERARLGKVESILFLGNYVHLNTRLEDGNRAVAELTRDQNLFSEGETIWLHWQPADELHFE